MQDLTLQPHMDPKKQGRKPEKSTDAQLESHWTPPNPPHSHRIPTRAAHFRQYNIGMAYIAEIGTNETFKQFKRSIYGTLRTLAANSEDVTSLRITRKYPATPWKRAWRNLHTAEASDTVISTWYQAIHDILPTNERLETIRLTDTSLCVKCRKTDTIQHRIVERGEGPLIWHWTRTKIATILKMDPRSIPVEWTVSPDAQIRHPQNQTAVMWLIAHLVAYRLQPQRRLSMIDYMEFLRRARWRLYNITRRPKRGKYLDIR
jgi:hypothetical protein